MRNVPGESCREIKTHITCSITFFFENLAVYEIMWENIVERGRPQMTIWRMGIAWCIPQTTNPHSEYVTFTAFPQQQWLLLLVIRARSQGSSCTAAIRLVVHPVF
jgi:hypothetical protein